MRALGSAVVILAVIGGVIWFNAAVFGECRAFGHSVFYCVAQMAGR